MINEIKIQMNANKNNIIFARGSIASFLVNLDLSINQINEVKTIVSEAVTNSIVHGYKNDESKIVELTYILDNHDLTMIIKDNGIGIEDVDKAREPLFTSLVQEERAGLGFTIMEVFSDELEVISKENFGTTVIVKKKLISDNNEE